MKRLLLLSLLIAVSTVAIAETYYWKLPYSQYGAFGDANNWSNTTEEVSTTIPGASDTLFIFNNRGGAGTWYYDYAKFDLGGETREIGGYLAEKGFCGASLGLTNGTFVVHNPGNNQQSTIHFDIRAGATLKYQPDSTDWIMVGANGTMDQWVIDAGGRGEMYGKLRLGGVPKSDGKGPGRIVYQVKAGGALVYALTGLNTSGNNFGLDGVYFENSGTFTAANGIDWNGVGNNNDSTLPTSSGGTDNMRFVQKAGTMTLGGDFCKTACNVYYPGNMRFELVGGTLAIDTRENTAGGDSVVSFYTAEAAKNAAKGWGDQVFASMPENASATVDVADGSILDMTAFAFSNNTALVKTGAGRLDLTNARPTAVSISAGAVRFAAPVTDWTGVTAADNVCVMFGVPGNSVDGLANATGIRYSLSESFPLGGTIVSASNADVLSYVLNHLTVPPNLDGVPTIVEGTIVLKPRVVIQPYPRTLVAGSAPTGNGYRIVSGPDDAADHIAGTPVYGFGGYAEGGEAGTYELTVSGLESDTLSFSYQSDVLTVITADDAKTFYWKEGTEWDNYWDTNNWSFLSDHSDVATRLPCELDKIWTANADTGSWLYQGRFNLGGGTYEIDTYDATGGTAWHSYIVAFSNGTMVIRRPPSYDAIGKQQSPRYEVYGGATLRYPYGTVKTSCSPSGMQERWLIHAGGRGEIYNYEVFCSNQRDEPFCEIDPEGTLVFDPTGFGTTANNYGARGARLVNRGTMLAPHGINWSNYSYSNDKDTPDKIDRVRFIQQEGRMLLGGDFCKTKPNFYLKGEMVFELKGGTLEVTNTVTFYTAEAAKTQYDKPYASWGDQVFAEMTTNAVATVQVDASSSIDMTPFTYGEEAALTKTGPGTVLFGSTLPARLAVNGGTVSFAAPTAATEPSTVAIGADFTGAFALRVWKNAESAVTNDTLDLTADFAGNFTISPKCHGFVPMAGDVIRLGDYASSRALPDARFAGRNWEFCRVAADPDALYLKYVPRGLQFIIK